MVFKIDVICLFKLCELPFCEENYPEKSLLEFLILDTMLNFVNSLLPLHKLSVDIVSLLNGRQRLLLNILLKSCLLICPLPLCFILLFTNHHHDICDPKVLYELLELLQVEPISFVGHGYIQVDLLAVESM